MGRWRSALFVFVTRSSAQRQQPGSSTFFLSRRPIAQQQHPLVSPNDCCQQDAASASSRLFKVPGLNRSPPASAASSLLTFSITSITPPAFRLVLK